jgi:hypothetical protein
MRQNTLMSTTLDVVCGISAQEQHGVCDAKPRVHVHLGRGRRTMEGEFRPCVEPLNLETWRACCCHTDTEHGIDERSPMFGLDHDSLDTLAYPQTPRPYQTHRPQHTSL